MKLVIFGLSISSSWGNGHATLWRGLCRALARRGHTVVFFERDVPYYARHRDLHEIANGRLELYADWARVRRSAARALADTDVAMVTSCCPDGVAATELVLSSGRALAVFYDLDTPVTLAALSTGRAVPYVGPNGLADFDLVLSCTGGAALAELRSRLGARVVAPLYGSVDPEVHRPVPPREVYSCDLSYLGTYAADRQHLVETLLLEPARRLPGQRFLLGGALYPHDFPWQPNIRFIPHVPPPQHAHFYCSSRLTLNVTRGVMARMGFCPSGWLFEAAACGVPVLSDVWEGLDWFFDPGTEILIATSSEEAVDALRRPAAQLAEVARAARRRALAQHTAEHRVSELERLLDAHSAAPPARAANVA